MHLTKPKPSDRERVINGLIRCGGVAVQIRTLSKNIRNVGTDAIKCKYKSITDISNIVYNLLYY